MTHIMKLNSAPYESIKNGDKTIELRLYDEKRRRISIGDRICFQLLSDEEQLNVEVINVFVFDSFEELYKALPLDKCGYKDVMNASPADMEVYYSKQEQAKHGVVGIEFILL